MGSNLTGVRDFFSFSVWVHFLSRTITQKVLLGDIYLALQLYTFKPLYSGRNICNRSPNDRKRSSVSEYFSNSFFFDKRSSPLHDRDEEEPGKG